MLSFIRKQLSATNLMVVAALIFAMAGGAFAATGGGKGHVHAAGHHGHASKKGKKGKKGKNVGPRGPRGKQGPAGPAGETGPAGPAGPAGPTGPAGKNGTNGVNGKDGAPGKDGASVKLVSEEAANCENEEGLTYEIEGSGEANEVCRGPEGSPWTAGGTLPKDATETGSWALEGVNSGGEYGNAIMTISFPIPLEAAVTVANTHVVGIKEWKKEASKTVPAGCTVEGVEGTPSEPLAAEGAFCFYVGYSKAHSGSPGNGEFLAGLLEGSSAAKVFKNPATFATTGVGPVIQPTGSVMELEPELGEYAGGTWAVTG